MKTFFERRPALLLASLLFIALSTGCAVEGDGYGYQGDPGFVSNYYEPYGGSYGGWGGGYQVGPPARGGAYGGYGGGQYYGGGGQYHGGGGQNRPPGGGGQYHPPGGGGGQYHGGGGQNRPPGGGGGSGSHAYRPAPAAHAAPSIPSGSHGGNQHRNGS